MHRYGCLCLCVAILSVGAARASEATGFDLTVDGGPWLHTVTSPYDDSSKSARDQSYKVYTHLYDFAGKEFITKGHGGKYSHHRGLFIGWRETHVGQETYDTWHMPDCYQLHMKWLKKGSGEDEGILSNVIEWRTNEGDAFIREVRSIRAFPGENGLRIVDFTSELTALKGTIRLRGDLQHAGMQIRLANEVSLHEGSTKYVLPEGSEELEDDKVVGAWWVVCSAEIGGKRYWVMHMTPPDHPYGVPVYSIRRYARFGAFFEPDLQPGMPTALSFRIVLSEKELDRAAAQALYDQYSSDQATTD